MANLSVCFSTAKHYHFAVVLHCTTMFTVAFTGIEKHGAAVNALFVMLARTVNNSREQIMAGFICGNASCVALPVLLHILLYYQMCSIHQHRRRHRPRHLHRCPSPSILAVFVAYRAQSPSFHYRSIQQQFRVSSPMAADDDVDPIRFNRRWIPRPRGPHLHLATLSREREKILL